jgi:hypothetical protein
MSQPTLFEPDPAAGLGQSKPADDRPVRMTVMITVKAAPNPSERYGETVCVAGIRLDPEDGGWVRLYPINFRELDDESRFRKYDVVSLEATPNRGDPRTESWRPRMSTLVTTGHLAGWARRLPYLTDHVADSMCGSAPGSTEVSACEIAWGDQAGASFRIGRRAAPGLDSR